MMSKPVLELKNCCKSFDKDVLTNLNLTIKEGDFVSIMGKSGSGKTTLLNILTTIETMSSGEYYFDDKNINTYKTHKLRLNQFGFIFQNYNLLENHTLSENILLPYVYTNSNEIDKDYYNELIDKLGLRDLLNKKVVTLSGGEKQRVAIGRGIILDPKIIFADEPTGNLDEENALIILNLLKELNKEGKTIVLITHSSDAADFATTKYLLKEGSLHAY